MTDQLTSNAEALRLFFTEDIFLIKDKTEAALAKPVIAAPEVVAKENATLPKVETPIYQEPVAVLPTVEEPVVAAKPKLDFKFLGKNQKNILILVNDSNNEVSTEQGRELLRKLVNAIALTAKDFALVNYANYQTATYADFNDFFACKLVLAFGVDPQQLALAAQPLHQLQQIGETKLVFTTNLHDLDSDPASKKVLWGSLQQLK
jgi:hypothetical protein